MGDLLHRMVARVREPAGSALRIEPLLPPRYAYNQQASTETLAGGLLAGEATRLGHAESAAAAPVRAPVVPRHEARPAAAPTRTAAGHRPSSGTPPPDASRPRDDPEEAAVSPLQPTHGIAVMPRPADRSARDDAGVSGQADGAAAAPPVVRATEPTPITVRAQTMPRPPGESVRHPSVWRAPDVTPAAQAARASPDVSLSIGHIEVRSPPQPPAPRRTEFRPRLSLDEFLGRRPGAKR